LTAETSIEDIKEALQQSQMGKCLGYSGIAYKFRKSWKEPSKEENDDKKPDC